MAVLQKTRIEGLLTAQQGINITGGVLDAPTGDITTLTSNSITVNSTLKVGSGTTLTTSSITTSTANFTTIEADTYKGLPEASETLQGISYLTDNYLAAQTGKAVSAVAVYNFYQSITSQMSELEDRVVGVSGDAFDKNPPTLWSVKNYADQMSITGGNILDDVPDGGDMSVEKPAGSPTLNIHIKKFVTQTEFEVLNDIVGELTGGDTGIITNLGDRISDIESALPKSSFEGTTVYNYIGSTINNRLGWSDGTTVQNKISNLESTLSSRIDNLSQDLVANVGALSNRITTNTSDITSLEGITTALDSEISEIRVRVDKAFDMLGKITGGLLRYSRTTTSASAGKLSITLKDLGINLSVASSLIYIVCLNGFILKGPLQFPAAAGRSNGEEYCMVRGSTDTASYIETTNSLLANQELLVIAYGYDPSSFTEASTYSLSAINTISSDPIVKNTSKILW